MPPWAGAWTTEAYFDFAGPALPGFGRDGVKDDATGAGAALFCFGFFISLLLRF